MKGVSKAKRGPRRQFAALPWRRTEAGVEVLLITSRETRRWVIPKGWRKKDEPATITVARESLEETGAGGRVDETPLGEYRYQKLLKTGAMQRVRVMVYPLEVVHEHEDWPERLVREKLWTTPAEAARLVDEPDLQALIAAFAP
ncbi:MAG: NUDIX hydrolase [Phenylobacterium sp.]|nr:MAG: NUDIX hydrolase [Phenylobacterium sp.]